MIYTSHNEQRAQVFARDKSVISPERAASEGITAKQLRRVARWNVEHNFIDMRVRKLGCVYRKSDIARMDAQAAALRSVADAMERKYVESHREAP